MFSMTKNWGLGKVQMPFFSRSHTPGFVTINALYVRK